ncbi:gp53-like domain-containing protein [Globicatella sanguinis]
MKLDEIILAATLKLGHPLDKPKDRGSQIIVAKEDKKIAVKENGEYTTVATGGPKITEQTTENGWIDFPMDEGKFIIQYGTALVPSNATTSVNFPKPFPTKCLKIIGSQASNDHIDNVMLASTGLSTFDVNISGGANNETINWIAIGY